MAVADSGSNRAVAGQWAPIITSAILAIILVPVTWVLAAHREPVGATANDEWRTSMICHVAALAPAASGTGERLLMQLQPVPARPAGS